MSLRIILYLYLIMPGALIVYLVDFLFLGKVFKGEFPSNSQNILIMLIFLGLPHVLAGFLIVFSRWTYISFYKFRIAFFVIFIVFLSVLGGYYFYYFDYIVIFLGAIFGVFHVVKQQYGVLYRGHFIKNFYSMTSVFFSFLIGVFIYLGIFFREVISDDFLGYIGVIVVILCFLLSVFSFVSCDFSLKRLSLTCFWVNPVLIVFCAFFYIQEYFLLAIITPRLIHDLTAYFYYIDHEQRFFRKKENSTFFGLLSSWNVPVFLILPMSSIVVAIFLFMYEDVIIHFSKHVTLQLIGYDFLPSSILWFFVAMHYYTESFMWKRGSPLTAGAYRECSTGR